MITTNIIEKNIFFFFTYTFSSSMKFIRIEKNSGQIDIFYFNHHSYI